MITNGKRIFVTLLSIYNTPITNESKKKKPKDLLEEMATRKKLDMPNELSLQANDIKVLHQINDSESSVSLLS